MELFKIRRVPVMVYGFMKMLNPLVISTYNLIKMFPASLAQCIILLVNRVTLKSYFVTLMVILLRNIRY